MENDVKTWELERYLLGELPPDRMEAIRRLVDSDPAVWERLETIKRSNQEIFSRYEPAEEAPKIRAAIDRSREKPRFGKAGRSILDFKEARAGRRPVFALVAASALILFVGGFLTLYFLRPAADLTTRSKGGDPAGEQASIRIHQKAGFNDIVLEDGDTVKAGDLLQISYTAGPARFGVIISLDGRGTVTLHFPDSETGSTELQSGRNIPLPNSYELDESPDFERFFFVTSTRLINVRTVWKGVTELGRDPVRAQTEQIVLPRKWSQFSCLLLKGSRP